MIGLHTSDGPVPMDEKAFLAKASAMSLAASAPFDDSGVALLAALSARLLKSADTRRSPQFTALGYWLRPAMIGRAKQGFFERLPDTAIPTGRGLAFHLPPMNVDTLFVYSWALAVLAGNTNIVRLPSTITPTTGWLIDAVVQVIDEVGQSERHVFCAYDRDSGAGRAISALSDLRMIWGGDEKVNAVSRDPVRPDGLSLGFSDRESFSVFNAKAYADASDAERTKAAASLHNDIYWFDQLGCGSPRVLFWVGEPGGADRDLYGRLSAIATQKDNQPETGIAISKFSFMNDAIAEGSARTGARYTNALHVLEIDALSPKTRDGHGGGFLSATVLPTLSDLSAFVTRKTQTITHFGFEGDDLRNLGHSLIGKGGYRIVPVGDALSFEETWDGVPLLDHMSRRIVVRAA